MSMRFKIKKQTLNRSVLLSFEAFSFYELLGLYLLNEDYKLSMLIFISPVSLFKV